MKLYFFVSVNSHSNCRLYPEMTSVPVTRDDRCSVERCFVFEFGSTLLRSLSLLSGLSLARVSARQ